MVVGYCILLSRSIGFKAQNVSTLCVCDACMLCVFVLFFRPKKSNFLLPPISTHSTEILTLLL